MTAEKGEESDFTISGLEYSVNNSEWKSISENGISEGVTFGGSNGGNLRLRGKNKNGTSTSMWSYANISFTPSNENSDTQVACTGDIRTLLDYENYNTVETSNARFCRLFENCTQLTSAPELPATTLANSCYSVMFNGCTSLTTAPELKATTLAKSCYYRMFNGCTSLTQAPELKATTLADKCYLGMFAGCTLLTTAPALKAETLAESCYQSMFQGCTKLQSVTMLATGGFDQRICLSDWLDDAGTVASSRTLKVVNKDAYDKIVGKNYLPTEWKAGTSGTTILDKDGNNITSSITLSSSN